MAKNNLLSAFLTQAQISNLTEMDITPSLLDEFIIVDVDDDTEGSRGTPKKIKYNLLLSSTSLLRLEYPFTNQTSINIVHSFGKKPLAIVVDENDQVIGNSPRVNGISNTIFDFSQPVSGTAILLA